MYEFRVLSAGQVARLHEASLTILDRTGVQVPHTEMRKMLRDAGARVDEPRQRVHFSPEFVQRSLDQAGKQFTMYGRGRDHRARFGFGERNYNSNAGEALWVDDDFSERRYPTLADVRTAAILGDALPNINMVGAMADPQDVPHQCRCVAVAAELLRNTTKPITFWFYDRASAKYLVELFDMVSGGREQSAKFPLAYPLLEPISPLRFPALGIDILMETCKVPLPVPIGPMAQTGATAPGTLAGTLAQENAEILAGNCIVQTIRPGTPVCYGGIPHIFDMSTTQMVFCGPEQALMAVAMTQMGKHYGLPVYINVGLSDSKIPDAQAGMEVGITLMLGALAGADIFGHLGICGVDLGTSLTMLAMQHETISYVERVLRGFEIDADTLGLDIIDRVAPGVGNYLAEDHTFAHFRQELWNPLLLDRNYWEGWRARPDKDLAVRCRDYKNNLLREHVPAPMAEDLAREMDALVAAARQELVGASAGQV